VDVAILHEIVRVVQSDGVVPEKVRLSNRSYEITYLDDHRQRIEEALRRRDTDRLGMLFGQLTSKVKYQLLKERAARKKRAQAGGRVVQSRPKPTGAKKPARGRTRARSK
jgi:hypothetical protein